MLGKKNSLYEANNEKTFQFQVLMTNNFEKVRIIIVGDSGVGKTCLTHLIAHNECLSRPGWTVGCNIEVKLYEYKEATPQQCSYCIELFDIGGSFSHKNTRNVFYTPAHGIILVHDLTNRRSQENLREWLYEILNKDGKDTYKCGVSTTNASQSTFDPEQFLGATQIPILVVGTKLDLIDDKRQTKSFQKIGGIADQCGSEEIWLNCRNPNNLSAGTTDAVKLSRFFDHVIEKKTQPRDNSHLSNIERRRHVMLTPYTSPESSLLLQSPQAEPMTTSTPKLQRNVLLESN